MMVRSNTMGQWSSSSLRLAALGLSLLLTAGVAHARCEVVPQAANAWVEQDGKVQKVRLPFQVYSERPGAYVTVFARVRMTFERADGWSSTSWAGNSTGVDAGRQGWGSVLLEAYVSNCSREQPCRILDVEVRELRCSD